MANQTINLEEIELELQDLGNQKDAVHERMRELVKIRDDAAAVVSAQAKAAAMSPAERAALGIPEPQIMRPSGIESEEVAGEF